MTSTGQTGPLRIGLYGGTFDPPHRGHLAVAHAVQEAMKLDEVRFVVANRPWQKVDQRSISDASIRLEMVKALLANESTFVVDDQEIQRGGDSFTIDTVEQLLAPNGLWRHGQPPEIYLIVGADAAAGLPTWHRASELAPMVDVVAVTRASGELLNEQLSLLSDEWTILTVEMEPIDLSSSQIRAICQSGGSLSGLVPPAVAQIIMDSALYR
ncbi:MAG: nicotinate (nicotinamide) nucleotide adenylyltransferase [Actinomycetota bacterium]